MKLLIDDGRKPMTITKRDVDGSLVLLKKGRHLCPEDNREGSVMTINDENPRVG